jgi:hypothetical protein
MADLEETQHPSFRLPTNKDIPIWRYMDLAKYLYMLEQRSLFFARATLLGDRFEGSSTKAMVAAREYIRANRATDPRLAAFKEMPEEIFARGGELPQIMRQKYLLSCWHMNEDESAAMWRVYSNANEAVCIRSTYRRLRQCLSKCVFIGEVNYINYDTGYFPTDIVLYYIMHKGKPYEYERELRAVFWEMDGTPEAQPYKAKIKPNGLAIEVDLSALIEHVYVSPTAAPWFADVVKAMTARCGFAFPVAPSALAEPPLY